MLHAREDYARIQDPDGKIPEDEPVFLIRAKDVNSDLVVDFWACLAEISGASRVIIDKARGQAKLMREWKEKKIPDIPIEYVDEDVAATPLI